MPSNKKDKKREEVVKIIVKKYRYAMLAEYLYKNRLNNIAKFLGVSPEEIEKSEAIINFYDLIKEKKFEMAKKYLDWLMKNYGKK
ncbi:MAG: hypothetical protein ACP5GJ_03785 [Nanopusillaceae archaeon]|jgi:uncharacterized Rossmann fold enzyme